MTDTSDFLNNNCMHMHYENQIFLAVLSAFKGTVPYLMHHYYTCTLYVGDSLKVW